MEVLGHSFNGTIQDILNLNDFSENRCYNFEQIEIFQSVAHLDTWGMEMVTAEKLTEKEVVRDLTNDSRSRDLNILMYENEPFALYQYIGKGNIENEVIFNKDVYLRFLRDYMSEYIEKKNIKVVDLNYEYTAQNYDYGIFIFDDNSITSICKTKLESYKK